MRRQYHGGGFRVGCAHKSVRPTGLLDSHGYVGGVRQRAAGGGHRYVVAASGGAAGFVEPPLLLPPPQPTPAAKNTSSTSPSPAMYATPARRHAENENAGKQCAAAAANQPKPCGGATPEYPRAHGEPQSRCQASAV